MANYATVADIISLKRALTSAEQTRAAELIPIVCDSLRYEAKKVGKNLDEMIYSSELVARWDAFTGDGETTAYILTETPASITTVMVGGAETSDYTKSGGAVTFTNAPDDGAEIMVVYMYRALLSVARSVTVDIVMRELLTSTNSEPMTQATQSALGYSVSGTFLVPGGGLFIKRTELARLGLRRQQYGVLDFTYK